jgi:hypothetical protein
MGLFGLTGTGGVFGPEYNASDSAQNAAKNAPGTVAPIADQARENIPRATDLAETAAGGARSAGQSAAGASGLSGAAGANAGAQTGGQAYSSTLAQVAPQLSEQQVQQRGQDINKNISQGEQNVQQRGQTMDYSTKLAGLDQQTASQNSQQGGQLLQAGSQWLNNGLDAIFPGAGTAASGLEKATQFTSDERCKTDISGDDGLLEALAKSVRGHTFRYKGSPHEEVGVMAQDLEKTPLKSTVAAGPDGIKRVDTQRLTMGNTAMIGDLARKLDKALEYIGRVR